ncbi:MAG: molybdopterin molybdotransferase MoeA [Xanthomonadales bacterium]|nr:molybdopterin molybdotransferase MoeA [Xanthomonadales bacterium]
MIAVEEAQRRVRTLARLEATSWLPAAAAIGRVLAEDLDSPVDLPPFDNAAMDGFALCTAGAVLACGSEWPVSGEQAAGDGARRLEPGIACEIMTGARIPEGADAVVPIEQVQRLPGAARRIRLLDDVRVGQHLRRAGEDVRVGSRALRAGEWITPAHLLVASGLGIARLPVREQPRVAVLCTGRELVDDPLLPLAAGQIRNGNGPYLAARLAAAGAVCVHRETVSDDADAFRAALARALAAGATIVLSTGAVSMGRYDFVPQTLAAIGAETLFHKVAMRPGKPLLAARLAGGQAFFGLPGNPVSSAVGLRFFVEPLLRAQLGLPDEQPWRARLLQPARKPAGVRAWQKARLGCDRDGRLAVTLLPGQESFRTAPLLDANAWAVLPEAIEQFAQGDLVEVYASGHELGSLLGEAST